MLKSCILYDRLWWNIGNDKDSCSIRYCFGSLNLQWQPSEHCGEKSLPSYLFFVTFCLSTHSGDAVINYIADPLINLESKPPSQNGIVLSDLFTISQVCMHGKWDVRELVNHRVRHTHMHSFTAKKHTHCPVVPPPIHTHTHRVLCMRHKYGIVLWSVIEHMKRKTHLPL